MTAPTHNHLFHVYQKDQCGADWPVAPKIVTLAGLLMGAKQIWKKTPYDILNINSCVF